MNTRIPGYSLEASNYCADCIYDRYLAEAKAAGYTGAYNYFTGAEPVLDAVAESRGIDRYDEKSYDSASFPKVIFDRDLDQTCEDADCGGCEDGHREKCEACHGVIE